MERLNLIIDSVNTVAEFEIDRGHIINVIMVDGVPAGVLPAVYIDEVKSKIMECME